jgi:hypothetical protein
LKPWGRTAFTTIVVSDGLSKSEHRRAARMGPRAVTSTRPLGVLMEAAGFEGIEVGDVTQDFIDTAEAWFEAFATRSLELRPLLGNEFDDRQKARQDMITAAGEGLLQRLLVSGTAPSR